MKTIEELNSLSSGTLMGHLEIHFLEVSEKKIRASMPVNEHTMQPFGRLHGGAALALSESVASAGSWAILDDPQITVLATEVSASHVGAAKNGFVVATGVLVFAGKRHHVWDVKIKDASDKDISFCRITNSLIPVR
ncbi:MAG: hotdog fold thioesterase [Paludibacter sp.]|nr:hotdog fold thioesterase [Paludibacter sp.]MDD4198885.1 hotdog fold thioesterase [Paludibacter sp.]MDD4426783.1 hotdog fold thioesterase [Paludibacter sp.]